MITSATRQNLDRPYLWEHCGGCLTKGGVSCRTVFDSLSEPCGLLEDLLQHEVLVIAEALVFSLKRQTGGCSGGDLPRGVQDAVAIGAEFGEITFL